MKYTSVEVLKDLPKYNAGSIIEALPNENGIFLFYDRVTYTPFFEQYPEWFRLISEPEFKVGGCAKAADNIAELTDIAAQCGIVPGLIVEVVAESEEVIGVKVNGFASYNWPKIWFTPATTEEYLKQEEGKKPWRPKNDEVYFFIASDGSIDRTRYNPKWESDSLRIEIGNCFRTEEAAEYFRDNFLKSTYTKYSEVYSTLSEEVK